MCIRDLRSETRQITQLFYYSSFSVIRVVRDFPASDESSNWVSYLDFLPCLSNTQVIKHHLIINVAGRWTKKEFKTKFNARFDSSVWLFPLGLLQTRSRSFENLVKDSNSSLRPWIKPEFSTAWTHCYVQCTGFILCADCTFSVEVRNLCTIWRRNLIYSSLLFSKSERQT